MVELHSQYAEPTVPALWALKWMRRMRQIQYKEMQWRKEIRIPNRAAATGGNAMNVGKISTPNVVAVAVTSTTKAYCFTSDKLPEWESCVSIVLSFRNAPTVSHLTPALRTLFNAALVARSAARREHSARHIPAPRESRLLILRFLSFAPVQIRATCAAVTRVFSETYLPVIISRAKGCWVRIM